MSRVEESTYAASAFHSGFSSGRESGTLMIDGAAATFRWTDGSVRIPLARLSMRRGGAGDRLVFFESPDFPEWSIYTPDRTVLRDPRLLAHPATAAGIAAIAATRRRGWAIALALVAGAALLLFGLAQLRGPLVAAVARKVPVGAEQKIGDLAIGQILLGASEITDPAITGPLGALLQRLESAAAEPPPYPFRLHLIDDPEVNAFALPGGHLAVHRGLLLEAESGEEIAGVLAHEMAHVTEQHSLRQIISTVGLFALVQALFGDLSGLVAVVAESGARLAALGFSRDAERDADRVGVETLRRASIDPQGMLVFFRKLRDIEQSRGAAGQLSEELAFLSTHPATSERIETLEAMTREQEAGETRPVDLDIGKLHELLQQRRR
ncbi:MAG TPA: M48 family metallopeptidase [Thermoanaerobaculia bacterium]|nr:M48 family metallopeptidase [Thermoanaerobaculia bacterium]